MDGGGGLKRRVRALAVKYKPRVVTAHILSYPVPASPPVHEQPDAIWLKRVTRADDRHLVQIEPAWRLRQAVHDFAHDEYALLAIDGETDRTVGKLWLARRERGTNPFEGPHVRLAGDEEYIYGVWVDPEYRRAGIAVRLCLEVIEVQLDSRPPPHWVHFFVDASNEAILKLTARFFPGWKSQEAKIVNIGPSFMVKIPFSDKPRFGPLSRRGRHSGDGNQVPGKPPGWQSPFHDLPIRGPHQLAVGEPDAQPGGPDWVSLPVAERDRDASSALDAEAPAGANPV